MPRSRPTGWSAYSSGQAHVVHGVAGLVQRAQQSGERLGGIEARGDAHVAGHALGERMFALIETAAIERKPDRLHDLHGERALLAGAELADDGQHGMLLLAREHFADQAGQPPRQRLEHRIDLARGEAGAELIDERVVRREIARLAQQLRLVAHQVDDLFEMRREVFELAGLARVQPFRLGLGGGLGEARHQRDRRRDGEVALPAHLAQVRDLPVHRVRRCWPGRDRAGA